MSLFKFFFIFASVFIAQSAFPAGKVPSGVAGGINTVGSKRVSFDNSGIAMAANVYLPAGFDNAKKYPAVVVSHPWGEVKEQTSGLYARQLARQGFITLACDASHYGESGGVPRNLEDPAERVRDIRSAIGYLSSLPQVDAARIGTPGICAGGGYTLHEAQSDPRVKAVASVVTCDIGDATRNAIEGIPVSASDRQKLMQCVDKQLNSEASGAPLLTQQLLPSRDTLNRQTLFARRQRVT